MTDLGSYKKKFITRFLFYNFWQLKKSYTYNMIRLRDFSFQLIGKFYYERNIVFLSDFSKSSYHISYFKSIGPNASL